jgi:protein-tyrosine phosphatase
MNTNLYWIEGPWPGRLAVSPRPRGGEWLEDEILGWAESGVDVAVSLLIQEERSELDLNKEEEICRAHNISFFSFPIEDLGVPASRNEAVNFVNMLEHLLVEGHRIVVHCRGGIGRSGLIAASVLVTAGIEPETAIRLVSDARGISVPETAQQIQWVRDFADAAALTR